MADQQPLISQDENCVSLNNWPCQARPTLANIKSNQPFYYQFPASIKKFGGRCNTIEDPYAGVCAPNKVKIVNVKVFKLMLVVNETTFLVQHELRS